MATEFPPALQQRLLQLFDDVHCAHVAVINLRDRSVVLRQSASEHNPAAAAASAPPQALQDAYIAAVAAAAAPFDSDDESSGGGGVVEEGGWETLRMHAPPHWDVYAFRYTHTALNPSPPPASGVKNSVIDRFVMICFYHCRKV